jgi:hypothetical protein
MRSRTITTSSCRLTLHGLQFVLPGRTAGRRAGNRKVRCDGGRGDRDVQVWRGNALLSAGAVTRIVRAPVAESMQFERCEFVADVVLVVYKLLRRLGAREGVFGQLRPAKCGERINAFAEVDRLAGEQNFELWDELNHWSQDRALGCWWRSPHLQSASNRGIHVASWDSSPCQAVSCCCVLLEMAGESYADWLRLAMGRERKMQIFPRNFQLPHSAFSR